MGFKENLLKKIDIDRMAKQVIRSFKRPRSGIKFDRDAMRSLLEQGGYTPRRERDLDLYVLAEEGERQKILVFENGLPIFHTTLDDVILRKSPDIDELIDIRNIIKVYNDGEVIANRKRGSVNFIRKRCIGTLDLNYTSTDIKGIALDGMDAVEAGDTRLALQTLTLFKELMGLREVPKFLQFAGHSGFGTEGVDHKDRPLWGPLIYYERRDNRLLLADLKLHIMRRDRIEELEGIIRGKAEPALAGPAVFDYLYRQVVKRRPIIEA